MDTIVGEKFPDPVARFLSIRCNFPLNLQQLKTSQEHNFFCSWAFCWKETERAVKNQFICPNKYCKTLVISILLLQTIYLCPCLKKWLLKHPSR